MHFTTRMQRLVAGAAAVKLDEQAVLEEYEQEAQARALKTVIQP